MVGDSSDRVVIIVDRPLVAATVAMTLKYGEYRTRIVQTVIEATRLLGDWRPQLVVIDMDLGEKQLLQQLGVTQDSTSTPPIIGLTRRGDLEAKLDAFEQGVDDVMTEPFSPEELLARALVIRRRSLGIRSSIRPTIRLGGIEIDILRREVRAGTSVIHLTGLEQSLLYLLAVNAGRVVSREEILDAPWGVDFVADSNVVDRHVRSLRAKLQNDSRRPRLIETIPGQGYRFVPTSSDTREPSS